MSDIEQWEHDEQRAMETEIAILRGQVSTLTAAYENAVAQHNKTLDELRASPASAPECVTFIPDRIRKVESGFKGLFIKEAKAYKQGWNDCRAAMLAAAPTPPVSEDRKDAERFRDGWTHSCNALCIDGLELWIPQCPHCGKPAPTPPVSEDRWLPIETAPKETTQMFVVVAFGAKVGATPYNSDPWCVWHQRGEFVRWPHKFSPTHWMPLPEAPAMQEDKP